MSMLDRKMATRRQQILEAARRLIESQGYEGLTMRNLAVESGVSVPTLYNLVGNKEQVFFAAVEDQTRAFVSSLERAGGDLIGVIETAVRQLVRRPRYYRALLLVLAHSERAGSARRHVGRAIAEQIAASLAELADAGRLAEWVDRASKLRPPTATTVAAFPAPPEPPPTPRYSTKTAPTARITSHMIQREPWRITRSMGSSSEQGRVRLALTRGKRRPATP